MGKDEIAGINTGTMPIKDRLRGDPAAIKRLCEEVIRIESPVQSLMRRATRDVELGGTLIPEGSLILARYGAANRDPEKFACPHAFDIDRPNVGAHLAYGSGTHFCVGATLARLEMNVAFTALLDRLEETEGHLLLVDRLGGPGAVPKALVAPDRLEAVRRFAALAAEAREASAR